MKYFTVEAETYDEAVKKARELYGSKIRVHSRKDTSKAGFFGSKRQTTCEITCFLSEEDDIEEKSPLAESQESEEIKPERIQVQQTLEFPSDEKISTSLLEYADSLLVINEFSSGFRQWMKAQITEILLKALPDVPTKADIQLAVADRIAMAINIDHKTQSNLPSLCVVVGPSQGGKTSVAAKMAAMYPHKEVGFIALDSQPNAIAQAGKISEALGIEFNRGVEGIQAFSDKTLVVADGISHNYCLDQMPSELASVYRSLTLAKAKYFAVIPATMKNSDIDSFFSFYKNLEFKAVVVTKEDESTTIGNIISAVKEKKVPLAFVSSGRRIPKDFKKATAFDLLGRLKGFSIDFASYS